MESLERRGFMYLCWLASLIFRNMMNLHLSWLGTCWLGMCSSPVPCRQRLWHTGHLPMLQCLRRPGASLPPAHCTTPWAHCHSPSALIHREGRLGNGPGWCEHWVSLGSGLSSLLCLKLRLWTESHRQHRQDGSNFTDTHPAHLQQL